jgi:hypothetical protein
VEEALQRGKSWSGIKRYKPGMLSEGPCSIWEVQEDEDNYDIKKLRTINISNASLFDIRYLQPSIIQSLCYSLFCHIRVIKIISFARFFKLKANNILNPYVMLKYETENMKIHSISNARRVLNVVCFLLGNSPASEFCVPTFRNTLSVPSS